jgi:hypothetical protein
MLNVYQNLSFLENCNFSQKSCRNRNITIETCGAKNTVVNFLNIIFIIHTYICTYWPMLAKILVIFSKTNGTNGTNFCANTNIYEILENICFVPMIVFVHKLVVFWVKIQSNPTYPSLTYSILPMLHHL